MHALRCCRLDVGLGPDITKACTTGRETRHKAASLAQMRLQCTPWRGGRRTAGTLAMDPATQAARDWDAVNTCGVGDNLSLVRKAACSTPMFRTSNRNLRSAER